MSWLKQSSIRPPCDQCRLPFEPTYGGVCTRCRRMLCGAHLYGSIRQRLRGLAGLRAECVRCRSETATKSTG